MERNSLGPVELLKWNPSTQKKRDQAGEWTLSALIIGEECLWHMGVNFINKVGDTPCKRHLVTNGTTTWWIPREPELYWALRKPKAGKCIIDDREKLYLCYEPGKNPYSEIPTISKFWKKVNSRREKYWEAPDGLFWICGKKASYPKLPPLWKRSCTLGIIQPGFFLLPGQEGDELGIPLYDTLKRDRRELVRGSQKWGDDEWPPERIVETYGLATWAQDGSWAYRTPIYVLNRIIRLQAAIEIITNQTASALALITHQQRQARAAIYQNRLALDYLVAEEGGVCGKFNTSDCCIKIEDRKSVV